MLRVDFSSFLKKRTPIKESFPSGMVLFCGGQGKGKTLSATNYIAFLKKKYPDLIIFSNISFNLADKVLTTEEIADFILYTDPKNRPIAFLLDEIQTVLFNSKKAVAAETFFAICQQRKAKKTIVGTLQQILDLDIRYRRQLRAYVEATMLGNIQIELWKDPESMRYDQEVLDYVAKTYDIVVWKRHDEAFNRYDTFEIVRAIESMDKNALMTYNNSRASAAAQKIIAKELKR